MEKETRNRIAVGLGFLAGTALGYFLASDKGRQLRHEAGEKLTDLGHQIGDTAKEQARKISSNLESMVEEGKELVGRLSKKVGRSTETAEEILEDVESRFHEGIEKARKELKKQKKLIDEAVDN
jgi:gas vesicle protein